MANSVDPDQLAASEANWSRSTLFAMAGHIQVQQDLDLNGIAHILGCHLVMRGNEIRCLNI